MGDTAQLVGSDGDPLQRSLFAPIDRSERNELEREVAVDLDAETSLACWHRNVARHQDALQGWRRERIDPDFLFALLPPAKSHNGNQVVVLELKGEHLSGNLDTADEQAVLQLMTTAFQADQVHRIGQLNWWAATGPVWNAIWCSRPNGRAAGRRSSGRRSPQPHRHVTGSHRSRVRLAGIDRR
jgi:type III restriction enzyme